MGKLFILKTYGSAFFQPSIGTYPTINAIFVQDNLDS